MKNKNFSFIIVFLLGVLLPVEGQKLEKEPVNNLSHFLEIGLGINYHGIRDNATSPLIYQGFLPSFHLEYFMRNNKFLGIAENCFSIGYLKTRNYPASDGNKATSYNDNLSLRSYFKIAEAGNSPVSIYAGGDIDMMGNVRLNNKFNNASLNYEIVAALAPSMLLEYRTSWNAKTIHAGFLNIKLRDRALLLQYSIGVPVLSDILKPGYVTISDFVDNSKNAIDIHNFKLTSFNKFFMVNNRIMVYYILHNQNMLKLEYKLGYFNYYHDQSPVNSFTSTLMLSIVFRFSNN